MVGADLNVIQRFQAVVQKFPDQVVYEDVDARLSFEELWALGLGAMTALRQAGIERGDRVALLMEDGPDYLAALVGTWMCAATVVPINRTQQPANIDFILGQSAPHLTLTDASNDREIAGPRLDWPSVCHDVPSAGPAALTDGDDAMILYTSGTTGVPKGVRHSHAALTSNALDMSAMLALDERDRVFLNIPFYYSNSISHILMALFNGACICARHGFLFGDALVEEVRKTEATGFAGVPAHYVRLVDAVSEPPPTHLRFLMNSGDHLPVNVLKSLQRLFPESQIFCVYGISEYAPRVSCLEPELLSRKIGSVGRPLGATQISIHDEDGTPLPAGELGEVYVRGPCLMKEYYANPEATAASLTAHGFRTGDLGYLDEDGCLYLSGRKDSVFKSGGEKVSCRLIEETLRDTEQCPSLMKDLVATAVPDHFLGNVPCVYYVPVGDNATGLRRLRRTLRQTLPRSHMPSRFVAVKAIERSPSGKVLKSALATPENLLNTEPDE